MSCGVGQRRGSDPALLWLLCRPAAIAPIWLLDWEPLYATGEALKRQKKKKKKKRNLYFGKEKERFVWIPAIPATIKEELVERIAEKVYRKKYLQKCRRIHFKNKLLLFSFRIQRFIFGTIIQVIHKKYIISMGSDYWSCTIQSQKKGDLIKFNKYAQL